MLFVGATLATGCEDRRTVRPPVPESVVRAPGAEPDDIGRTLDGQTVRVAGDVEEVLSDAAFLLEGDDLVGERTIAVVARDPVMLAGIPIADRHEVVVTGIVRTPIDNVERELGRELPADVERAIGDRPVVVAREVRRRGTPSGWTNE